MTTGHLVHECEQAVAAALDKVDAVELLFLSPTDKADSLLALERLEARVAAMKHRLLAVANDVADQIGARDVGTWFQQAARVDRSAARQAMRLAKSLDTKVLLAAAYAAGDASSAQVDVVAPEVGEDHERRQLEDEERRAREATRLTTQSHGDGTTTVRIRMPDASADRLTTYLHAWTKPRRPDGSPGRTDATSESPYPVRLGQAFCALLEHLDPARLPTHGGTATTVLVTIPLDRLLSDLGVATTGSDGRITTAQTRRLACTANLVPVVLGGTSEILDVGRAQRLFTAAQRRALAVRDQRCRAVGCDVPAAWAEAPTCIRGMTAAPPTWTTRCCSAVITTTGRTTTATCTTGCPTATYGSTGGRDGDASPATPGRSPGPSPSPSDDETDLHDITEADALGVTHGVLERQEVGPLPREHRGGEGGLAQHRGHRDHSPVGDVRLDLVDQLGLVGRQREEEIGGRSPPLDDLAGERQLHAATVALDIPRSDAERARRRRSDTGPTLDRTQRRSNRSLSMTLVQAATKSRTNFSPASSLA